MFSFGFSVLLGAAVLLGNEAMLCLLFGKVEQPVMEACITYLRILVYSYPVLAVYNTGATVYRSLGKTNVTMYILVVSNMINVIGNVIGIALAMVCDWVVRAVLFIWRERTGKWKTFQVIKQ